MKPIEMAMQSVIDKRLDRSGWSYIMTAANVSTEGQALIYREDHIHPQASGFIRLQQRRSSSF